MVPGPRVDEEGMADNISNREYVATFGIEVVVAIGCDKWYAVFVESTRTS